MNGFIIKNNPSIRFPEDNEIVFFQDMQWWKGLPGDISFYPRKLGNTSMWFVGDGYGMMDSYGLPGKYGNGSIAIPKGQLPQEIWDWAVEHQIEPLKNFTP